MKRKIMERAAAVLLVAALANGCSPDREAAVVSEGESPGEGVPAAEQDARQDVPQDLRQPGEGERYEIQMVSRDGGIMGTAVVEEEGDGVLIHVDFAGLAPGRYGFHLHETASCEPPGFESAGDHFDMNDRAHGFEDPEGPHDGDLPNVEVDEDGVARMEIFNARTTLEELRGDDGSALVLHAEPDDYLSDPAGDAGDRIACGILPPR